MVALNRLDLQLLMFQVLYNFRESEASENVCFLVRYYFHIGNCIDSFIVHVIKHRRTNKRKNLSDTNNELETTLKG